MLSTSTTHDVDVSSVKGVCQHYSVVDLQCPADVTKQPVMLGLLALLSFACVTWWSARTFLHGSITPRFLSTIKKNQSEWTFYWTGNVSFVVGQVVSYTTNLLISETAKLDMLETSCKVFDPLSIYIAVLLHDDIVGSIFRFGTWSCMQRFWNLCSAPLTAKAKASRFDLRVNETTFICTLNCARFVAAWAVQVVLSNFFAFTIYSISIVTIRHNAPVVFVASFVSNVNFESCIHKTIYLAASTRFSLEALHAIAAPVLIRVLSQIKTKACEMV